MPNHLRYTAFKQKNTHILADVPSMWLYMGCVIIIFKYFVQ